MNLTGLIELIDLSNDILKPLSTLYALQL